MFSWKKRLAVSLATGLEFYDIAVYSAILIYVTHNFFPESYFGKSSAILGLMTFALRYLTRPIGGFIMGKYADYYGRRKALITTCIISGFSTLCMACLPTYQQIGLLAPILFFLMQLMQAFSYGGENPVSIIYILENTPKSERGRTGGIIWGMIFIILAFSTLIVYLLKLYLSSEDMLNYGWRIPLLLGLVNLIFSVYFRLRLSHEKEVSSKRTTRLRLMPIIKVFLVTAPSCLLFYINAVLSSTLTKSITSDATLHTFLSIGFNLAFTSSSLFAGYLIDKFSDCKTALTRAYFIMTLFGVPLYILQGTGDIYAIIISQVGITYIIGTCIAAGPSVMYDFLGRENKGVTFGLGYNIGAILFGGFAPLMLNFLSQFGQAYIGLLISFGGICYFIALAIDKYVPQYKSIKLPT